MRKLLGSLIRLATIPMNRLKVLPYSANINNPKDIVNVELMQAEDDNIKTDIDANIGALMARMGLVVIPSNIALSPFPNPIAVNGRNYTLLNKQRVLLIGQTTSAQNGVYEVSGTNLVRINDLIALDGIVFSGINQIGVNRWNNVANALQFKSGQLAVEVDTTSTNAFGGIAVVNGKIKIDETTLPGFAGSLTIEQLLTFIGVASKVNFSQDFAITWDGLNARATVGLNAMPSGAIIDQSGVSATPYERFLFCNGATVSVASEPTLFAAIGSTYTTNVEINRPSPRFVPAGMTSNNQGGYIASASENNAGAFNAFDSNAGTSWQGVFNPTNTTNTWIRAEMPEPMAFENVTITLSPAQSIGILASKIQASDNGSTWTDILTGLVVNSDLGWSRTFTIASTTSYRYWRFLVTDLTNPGTLFIVAITFSRRLYDPIQFFQVPNLANPATNVRKIIRR
jgi:hypothetical protein